MNGFDDATLMAFVDGELDAITARRVERAAAADPALQQAVAAQRALRDRLGAAFAGVAQEPVPDRLAALLTTNVVPLRPAPRAARPRPRWLDAAALAACLVLGVTVGQHWTAAPVTSNGNRLVASGPLARALDTQLASTGGETRILASFRDHGGSLCRVFGAPSLDGIACRDGETWSLRRTQMPEAAAAGAYRQAGSSDAALLAAAQDMMAGDPLDAAAERRALSNR